MVYSGIYLSNSSTIKSKTNGIHTIQSNGINHNVSHHLKRTNSKKLSSTGSTSNRSSESSRFNETNSNVTIKSDISKFDKNPKLAPEIIFLIKEHAKTLETINQISKKLQEIELKVDDISQRLSKENSLSSYAKQNPTDRKTVSSDSTQDVKNGHHLKIDSSHQKDQQQTRPPYSALYKDVDHHLSTHLSNNLSNNPTNIPNNQILSDDSGGEYGKTTTKTVSDDDELLSILEKITKCSHHILQTQQAYQQQGAAIYSSLSKPYAYTNQTNLTSNQFGSQQQSSNHLANLHNQSQQQNRHYLLDVYQQQAPPQLYPAMNPYLLNAKSPIKSTVTTTNQLQQQQTNNIHSSNYTSNHIVPVTVKYATTQQQQATSLNELLFEPNVERFLSNLDQLVCNDDTNLSAILGTNQQQQQQLITNNLMNSTNLPMHQHSQNQQFISPHQTSTPISNQPMPILSNCNLRTNQSCLNPNLSPNLLINPNYNNGNLINVSSMQTNAYLNNISLQNASPNHIQQQQQQYINWQKARELLEKKERERIDNQLKQADDWLGNMDKCIRYQQSTNKTNGRQHSSQSSNNLMKNDK